MRRQLLIAAAGVAAVTLSIPLALLGRAVLATPAAVARETTSWPADARVATRHRGLADRAAASLLAADSAQPFARIVRIYRTATALPVQGWDPTAPIRITRLIPELPSPRERGQALVMAGTLLAASAGNGIGVREGSRGADAEALLGQALADFRAAVRSDDTNEEAKFDLELLLKQQATSRRSSRPATRKGTKTPTKQTAAQKRRQKRPAAPDEIKHASVYATGSGY